VKHIILIIVFAFSSAIVFSQENALEETIKKQINYNDEDFFSFSLKSIPEIPNTAVAMAVKYHEKNDEEQYFTADLYLYVINIKKESIISTYVEKEKFTSDAVILEEVTFNSVPYMTNASVGTFGVKSNSGTHSRIALYGNRIMSLYHISDGKIKVVSDDIELYTIRGEGGSSCNLDYEETNSVIKVDTKKTNGFFNLKVISTKNFFESKEPEDESDDCIEENTTLAPVTQVLTFKNGKYSLE
jgi:hypothetical protein